MTGTPSNRSVAIGSDAAPPPGWYPDPRGGLRLRWWDGLDWTDRYRSRPNGAVPAGRGPRVAAPPVAAGRPVPSVPRGPGVAPSDVDAIVSQVRQATRAEVDRAADLFTQRARQTARATTLQIQPLITQYTSALRRWAIRLVTIAIVLIALYVAFQVIAQASLLDWLGDRVDNLTDTDPGGR